MGDDSDLRAVMSRADVAIEEFLSKPRPDIQLGANFSINGSGGRGAGLGDPAKMTAAAQARVEAELKVSQGRQENILREGEAKTTAIAQQGAAQKVSIAEASAAKVTAIEAEAAARSEVRQRESLARQAQEYERAQQRLLSLRAQNARNMEVGQTLNRAGNALTLGVTAPLAAGGTLVLREGMNWESSMAEVRRTVTGSITQIRALELQLRDMAAGRGAIPINVNELAKIAAEAGALGVNTPNVASITRTGAMLGTTTNMGASDATNFLARFANATGDGQKNFDRTGSALVALGQKSPATEREIAEMSLRIAGVGKQVGLTQPQILGFAAAIAGVGVKAQEGGSAISKTFEKIDADVRKGGDELEGVAKVAGMSAQAFKKAWETDAARAMASFIEGLKRTREEGGSAAGTLDELGLKNRLIHDTLLRAANAGGLFNDTLRTGEQAWKDNTALATAAGKRYETTASQLQILQSRAREVALTVSEIVLPGVNKELKGFSDGLPEAANKAAAAYEALAPAGRKAAIGVLAVGAGAGPMLKLAGTAFEAVGSFQKLAGAIKEARAAQAAASAASTAASVAPVAAEGLAGAGAAAIGAEGAVAGGGVAAAGLLSNPVGWVILAAAIVAGIGLLIKFKTDYEEVLERNRQLTHNAGELRDAMNRALSQAPDNKIKTQLEQTGEAATNAGSDVDKLKGALERANQTKVTISKMHVDPATKDPLMNEVQRIINSVQSTLSINLKVNAQNGGGRAPVPPGMVAQGGRGGMRPQTREERLVAMGAVEAPHPSGRYGTVNPQEQAAYDAAMKQRIALPQSPQRPGGPRGKLSPEDQAQYEATQKKYENDLSTLQEELEARQAESARLGNLQHQDRFDARAHDALKTYSNNLAELVKVQHAYNEAKKGGYKADQAELQAMGELASHVTGLKAKVQTDQKKRVDDAKAAGGREQAQAEARAKDDEKQRKAEDEALAEQARADRGQGLSKQLEKWRSLGTTVAGHNC